MERVDFPVEFNNEIDDVKKSENEFYTLAVDRLSKIAEGTTTFQAGSLTSSSLPRDVRHRTYTK